MTWQPIETAPKDGSLVLGYDGDFFTMQFCDWRGGWELLFGLAFADGSSELDPTHWMPLPPPPEPK